MAVLSKVGYVFIRASDTWTAATPGGARRRRVG
jgi:hypothetical protein